MFDYTIPAKNYQNLNNENGEKKTKKQQKNVAVNMLWNQL